MTQVIDSDKYEVIYVSPRNYFVFTPMLAAASVGTVDVRSITEPIRMANPCVKYVSGEVIDVNPGEKKVGVFPLSFFFGGMLVCVLCIIYIYPCCVLAFLCVYVFFLFEFRRYHAAGPSVSESTSEGCSCEL